MKNMGVLFSLCVVVCVFASCRSDAVAPTESGPDKAKAKAERFFTEGKKYYDKGDGERAVDYFTYAIELRPDYYDAYMWRSIAYRNLVWDHDKSLEDAKVLVELRPKSAESYNQLGWSYYEMVRDDEAMVHLNKALEMNSNLSWALLARGIIYHRRGEYDKAIKDQTFSLEGEFKIFWAYYWRAESYWAKGKKQAAIEDMTEAINLDPKEYSGYVKRGEFYRLMGELEKSLADVNKAVSINQKREWAYRERGEIKFLMGKRKEAIEDYNKAIEVEPAVYWAYVSRGQAYWTMGDLQQAIKDYNKAIEIDASVSWFFARRGDLYRAVGKIDLAKKDIGRAIELNPNDYYPYRTRALLRWWYDGKIDEVVLNDFNKAMELFPEYYEVMQYRGELNRQLGNYEQAMKDLNTAMSNLKNGLPYVYRGLLYQDLGEKDKAKADFEKALELEPNLAWGYFYRGVFRKEEGDIAGAFVDLSRAFELDKNVYQAKDVLAELKKEITPEVEKRIAALMGKEKKVVEKRPEDVKKIVPVEMPVQSQRFALVIGVSKYKDSRIPGLRYAAADAKSMYEWLVSPDGGRYAPSRVKLLLNEEATMNNVRDAMFRWLKTPIKEDQVLIYLAGHGSPESPDDMSNLFFLPHDTKYDKIGSTGFPMWDIETAIKRFVKAQKVIVIADICHAGGVGSEFMKSKRGVKNVTQVSSALNNLANTGDGVVVLSAADNRQFSNEGQQWGGGHGVFTWYLLEGLKGEADYNKDKRVTLGELIPYLSEKVRRDTKSSQSPTVAGKFDPAMSIAR